MFPCTVIAYDIPNQQLHFYDTLQHLMQVFFLLKLAS